MKYIASVGINGAGAPCYNVLAKLQFHKSSVMTFFKNGPKPDAGNLPL